MSSENKVRIIWSYHGRPYAHGRWYCVSRQEEIVSWAQKMKKDKTEPHIQVGVEWGKFVPPVTIPPTNDR